MAVIRMFSITSCIAYVCSLQVQSIKVLLVSSGRSPSRLYCCRGQHPFASHIITLLLYFESVGPFTSSTSVKLIRTYYLQVTSQLHKLSFENDRVHIRHIKVCELLPCVTLGICGNKHFSVRANTVTSFCSYISKHIPNRPSIYRASDPRGPPR